MNIVLLIISVFSFLVISFWIVSTCVDRNNFFPLIQSYFQKKTDATNFPKLTYTQFKSFVNVNCNKWNWPDTSYSDLYYGDLSFPHYSTKQYVWFKSFLDFVRSWFWWRKTVRINNHNKSKTEEMKNMAILVEAVRLDAENAQRRAEEAMAQSEKEIKEIMSRLQRGAH